MEEHFELAIGVGIVGVVVDHAALDVVRTLIQVDEVVVAVALVFDQSQIRLVPVIAVGAGGEADALEPSGVAALAEIPHPELVADAVDGAVVDDALAVRGAFFAQVYGDAGASAWGHVAFEVELDAALEWEAVVVEGKEHDLVQLLPGTAVVDIHPRLLNRLLGKGRRPKG